MNLALTTWQVRLLLAGIAWVYMSVMVGVMAGAVFREVRRRDWDRTEQDIEELPTYRGPEND